MSLLQQHDIYNILVKSWLYSFIGLKKFVFDPEWDEEKLPFVQSSTIIICLSGQKEPVFFLKEFFDERRLHAREIVMVPGECS